MIRDLDPASFAFVMATGIIGVSAHLFGMRASARAVAAVAGVAYAALWIVTLLRVSLHLHRVSAEFRSAAKGPAFLTVVAGTCVFGTQLAMLGTVRAAFALWLLGAVLWAGLMAAMLAVHAASQASSAIRQGFTGTWLMLTVATQSVAILGALAPQSAEPFGLDAWLFAMLGLWLTGCLLYVLIIVPICHRLVLIAMPPEQFTPSYWISMGALAISTVAGTLLIEQAAHSALFRRVLPAVVAGTLACWIGATAWIPLLALLTVWRRAVARLSWAASAEYWAFVFPLGMYAAATHQVASAVSLPLLDTLARVFLAIAAAAWVIGSGMLARRQLQMLARAVRRQDM